MYLYQNFSNLLFFLLLLPLGLLIYSSSITTSEYATVYLIMMLLGEELHVDISCGPGPKILTVLFILKVSLKARIRVQVLIVLRTDLSKFEILLRHELAHPFVPRYRL